MNKENWRVIYTASNSHFVGEVTSEKDNVVVMEPAFNWINESVMAGNGQMMLMRQATPLAPTVEASKLEIQYIGQQHVKDWDQTSQDEFFGQIDMLIKGMEQAQARKLEGPSKIVTPHANVDPRIMRDLLSK